MDIVDYRDFLPESVLQTQLEQAVPVVDVDGAVLRIVPWSKEELERCGLDSSSTMTTLRSVESEECLRFVVQLYLRCRGELADVLQRRRSDREFIDQMTADLAGKAAALERLTVGRTASASAERLLGAIGQSDETGRIPIGPLQAQYYEPRGRSVAAVPDYLRGPHVTLFGPPDSASLAINAMNSLLRRLPDEPAIVEQLLSDGKAPRPFWGADDEDSRTPLRGPLLLSEQNLAGCFDGSLTADAGKRRLQLEQADRLALPIKRFPGLALPMATHFVGGSPLPLHLYDFAVHVYLHRRQPEALTFYVPKLENEEEAAYLRGMIETAEQLLDIPRGSVRIMVVLENPRAVFRLNEIIDALEPYFVGASLGWHDYLASTARLFKNDPHYYIPVKSDPDIVIKHIKEAHLILASVVGGRGGIAIGGMYGVLPEGRDWRSPSFQVVLSGYIRDVVAQLRRGLTGFWVAHPDFVRIGVALVQAYACSTSSNSSSSELDALIEQLIVDPAERQALLSFVHSSEAAVGLDRAALDYPKSLLAAGLQVSRVLPNNHTDEVRYNVFQALQYLADWLAGNGCVALPAVVRGQRVRVMDDLATTERSRWEVWAEVAHGRFPLADFLRVVLEELAFIRANASTASKQVRVQWDEHTAKWYPVAAKLFTVLVCPADGRPVEFVTELLMTFTTSTVRQADDPWAEAQRLAPGVYRLRKDVALFNFWWEILPSQRFAQTMSQAPIYDDVDLASQCIRRELNEDDLFEALSYFATVATDARGRKLIVKSSPSVHIVPDTDHQLSARLHSLASDYADKFGFPFALVLELDGSMGASSSSPSSRQDVSERLVAGWLRESLSRSKQEELAGIRTALALRTMKRFASAVTSSKRLADESLVFGNSLYVPFRSEIEELLSKWTVPGVSITAFNRHGSQSFGVGMAKIAENRQLCPDGGSWFELQSLSKTVATAFTFEYFRRRSLSVDTPVNELLGNPALCRRPSSWRLLSKPGCPAHWAEQVTVRHLMNHSACGMHYCPGVSPRRHPAGMPPILELISGQRQADTGYGTIYVEREPGASFAYSGGGFMVLEHLLLSLSGYDSVESLTRSFLDGCGLDEFTFHQLPGFIDPATLAAGHLEPEQSETNSAVRHQLGPLLSRAASSDAFSAYRFISADYDDRLMFPAFSAGGIGTTRSFARFLQHLTRAYRRLDGSGSISHDTAVQMLGTDSRRLRNTEAFMAAGSAMATGVFVMRSGGNRFAVHQAAGDGYRGLFVSCFRGPDAGSGMVIACNGGNPGVLLNSFVALSALRYFGWSGLQASAASNSASQPTASFSFQGLPQEQIVNLGYRQLLFSAFEPERAELLPAGPVDPLAHVNLACRATIVSVTSDEFARADNLISPHLPVFDPRAFGAIGKVMDSWETARHNPLPADVLELQLHAATPVAYVSVCTMFHDGNHADQVRVEAVCDVDDPAAAAAAAAAAGVFDLVPVTKLQGHSMHRFVVPPPLASRPVSRVRVYNYPDGGITRLGLFAPGSLPPADEALFLSPATSRVRYAHAIPPVIKRRSPKPRHLQRSAGIDELWSQLRPGAEVDVASADLGGAVLRVSNQHYGPADAIISAYPPSGMFDGFETARARARHSSESVDIALGRPACIHRIVVDFTYFVANNPDSMSIEGVQTDGTVVALMPQTWTKPYAGNVMQYRVAPASARIRVDKVRVVCTPCGGFNRINFFTVAQPRPAL